MGDPYVAVRRSRDEFLSPYPDAVAEPVGELGFAAFGNGPIPLGEKLRRPDFDQTQMFLVLLRDADLYLAFAPYGEAVGYPPKHVRLRVTDWGPNVDPESVRQHGARSVMSTRGQESLSHSSRNELRARCATASVLLAAGPAPIQACSGPVDTSPVCVPVKDSPYGTAI